MAAPVLMAEFVLPTATVSTLALHNEEMMDHVARAVARNPVRFGPADVRTYS